MDFNNDSGTLSNVAIVSPSGTTITFAGSGAVTLPSGTTAQRPTSALGELRYNSDFSLFEFNNGTTWANVAPNTSISVTGSDFTMSGSTGTAITNATLATVNGNVGTFGNATYIPTITVNSKGLVTGVTTTATSSGSNTLAGLTDVALATVTPLTPYQKLTYNGTKWVNAGDEVDYVNVLTNWTAASGGLYTADVRHQLGTADLNVSLWNNAIGTLVQADSITLTDGTLASIAISNNTSSIKCVFTGGGMDQRATTLTSWTLVAGNLYSATFNHGLNTRDIIVTLWDTTTNKLIKADSVTQVDVNNVKVTIVGNTASIRCVVDASDVAITTGTWTASSGKYTTNIAHALGSTGLIIHLWNTATGASVVVDSVSIADGNNLTLTASTNAVSIRCAIIASGGIVTGSSGGSGTANALKAFSYYATSLDSPNNSDWIVNAMAPTVFDPLNGALTVRQFLNTSETGVGFTSSVPLTASYVTFTVKGRATTAPTAPNVNVVHNLYTRLIPSNAAVTAWTSPFALNTIAVPTTNTYYQYFTQTILLTTLGLVAGSLYQFEMTRSSTNPNILPYNWYVIEVTLTFT